LSEGATRKRKILRDLHPVTLPTAESEDLATALLDALEVEETAAAAEEEAAEEAAEEVGVEVARGLWVLGWRAAREEKNEFNGGGRGEGLECVMYRGCVRNRSEIYCNQGRIMAWFSVRGGHQSESRQGRLESDSQVSSTLGDLVGDGRRKGRRWETDGENWRPDQGGGGIGRRIHTETVDEIVQAIN